MTFLQTGQATGDPEFNLRVKAAIFKLAQDVVNEDVGTDNHVLRTNLAQRVIANPDAVATNFVWLCASNPSVAATVTEEAGAITVGAPDSDIEFVCASNWDIVSGWASQGRW